MLKQYRLLFAFVGLVLILNSSVLVARQYICVKNETRFNSMTIINGSLADGSLPSGAVYSPAKDGEKNTVVINICEKQSYPYCNEKDSKFIKKFGYANSPGDVYFEIIGDDKESLRVITVNKPCRPAA